MRPGYDRWGVNVGVEGGVRRGGSGIMNVDEGK